MTTPTKNIKDTLNIDDNDLFQEIAVEKEDSEAFMEKPFNPALINIELKSPTIFNLLDRMRQNPPEIDLYTEFQRRDDLWDAGKQSRLIESILVKFPLPAFFFDGTDDNKWLVVDGLQRLSALRNFVIKESLALEGLEFLKNLEGKRYNELPRSMKRIIDTTQVTAHIINPGTPPEVKFNIFRRINTGGLILDPQEIRHALNQGIPATFVAELATLQEFLDATGRKIPTARMADREFVTRFLAFYLTPPKDYTPDLDSFLNDSMARLHSLPSTERDAVRQAFRRAMVTADEVFGSWAFRKAHEYPLKRKPINKALFEVWSVTLARLPQEDLSRLAGRKEQVLAEFAALCRDDKEFMNSISLGTGEKTQVITRFDRVNQLVGRMLHDQSN